MRNYTFTSDSGDGYRNLAVDQYILQQYRSGRLKGVTLYFFVNANAVIIGRNQNAWRECNLINMKQDDVQLVRRHTGGGAVYHDCGNLNFSFITSEKHYDLKRQQSVVVSACRKFGINAEVTGRNDIAVDGRKFSGNAFALAGIARGHHGTMLVSADLDKLPRYLNVSQQKLNAKGITSVRSRVCNLSQLAPVTVDEMRRALIECFVAEYGSVCDLCFNKADEVRINELYAVQSSWEWRLGSTPAFDKTIETRLPSGEIQLHIKLLNGIVENAAVYTDSLETNAADEISSLVIGSRFDADELHARLINGGNTAAQLAEYIKNFGVQ